MPTTHSQTSMHARTHTHTLTLTSTYAHPLMQRHGKGRVVYSTGQEFEGEFKNDIINGEGDMRYNEVSKYHGGWLNGLVRNLLQFTSLLVL